MVFMLLVLRWSGDDNQRKIRLFCTEAYRVKNGKVGAPIKGSDPDWGRGYCVEKNSGGWQ